MARPFGELRRATAMLWIGVALVGSGCALQHEPPLPVPTAARPCPPWVLFPANSHSNADSPYLGCSTAVNLRAMVANPADLERGRPLGPADGSRETLAVENYQQGKVKPFSSSGSATAGGSSTSAGSGRQ